MPRIGGSVTYSIKKFLDIGGLLKYNLNSERHRKPQREEKDKVKRIQIIDRFSGPFESHVTHDDNIDGKVRELLEGWMNPGDEIYSDYSNFDGCQCWYISTPDGDLDIYATCRK
jgi:hypothetical protein